MRPAFAGVESGAEAAIDVEHRSGYERGFGAGEEHVRRLRFLPAVPKRCSACCLRWSVGEVAVVVRVHVGVDRARLQHVDGDAARAEVARRALGVADDSSLGGRVVGKARERCAGRDIGADRDDAAAFADQLRCRADRGDDAVDVDGVWRASAAVSLLGSSTGPPTATPALLTRMSSRPKSFATFFTS